MRIKELDYLKGVMIILVITFHLVYFEHLYPYAKQVVYTFHMPVFLVISGYLMNINKNWRAFMLTIAGLAIPYAVMESGYIVMASLLPINEHIDHLTLGLFFDKLLLHPLGPYWYLHTLILCGVTYYCVFTRNAAMNALTRFMLMGLVYYLFSHVLGVLALSSAVYFLAGVVLRQSNTGFMRFFQPSLLAIVAFVLLIMQAQYLNSSTLGGILIVYLAISSCLYSYKYAERRFRNTILFLGRNSLLLYVFSPIFTILCKQMVPYLTFDKSGILFLAASLTVCISGCLAIGWLMDRLRISPLFFMKQRVVSSLSSD
jgi:fucose 4-O-acetylase-like acetyltransferase